MFRDPEARRAGQTIAIMAIGWAVLSSMLKQTGEIQEDERDEAIEVRAVALGQGALMVGLIGVAVMLGLSPLDRLGWASPRMVAGIIVNLLVLKTLVEQNALVVMHWWDRR